MTTLPSPRSLTENAYACLRADILAGTFQPGQRLRPTELAKASGVSLNVVREALNRLAGERLVRASPQRGFAVVGLDAADLRDLTEVRELIETAALSRSIERGDMGWESRLVAAHYQLANTPMHEAERPGELSDLWAQAHAEFHTATMSACENPRLIEMVTRLGEAAAIYRQRSHFYAHDNRDVVGEHRELFEAAVARNVEEACRLHAAHVRRTTDIVVEALEHRHAT